MTVYLRSPYINAIPPPFSPKHQYHDCHANVLLKYFPILLPQSFLAKEAITLAMAAPPADELPQGDPAPELGDGRSGVEGRSGWFGDDPGVCRALKSGWALD